MKKILLAVDKLKKRWGFICDPERNKWGTKYDILTNRQDMRYRQKLIMYVKTEKEMLQIQSK